MTKTYETEAQLADRTGRSRRYWSQLRQAGGGPVFLKVNRAVLYDREVVDIWLAGHAVGSTSQATVRNAEAAQ